jgi:hypothetical protein
MRVAHFFFQADSSEPLRRLTRESALKKAHEALLKVEEARSGFRGCCEAQPSREAVGRRVGEGFIIKPSCQSTSEEA